MIPDRRPGRPRLSDETPSYARVNLPAPLHDRVCRVAIRRGVSVSEVIRQSVRRSLDDLEDEDD